MKADGDAPSSDTMPELGSRPSDVATETPPVFQRTYSALCAGEAGVPVDIMKEVLAQEGRDETDEKAKAKVVSAAQRIWNSRRAAVPIGYNPGIRDERREAYDALVKVCCPRTIGHMDGCFMVAFRFCTYGPQSITAETPGC